ncbi:NAD(P)-dependent oxidoreductase [Peribacillus cavernae]|uniref:UDP-glucose 4-epimerase n=1 Tax=Peribacillus cavernae TaxID=1674310 RepID=A0A433HWV1_9BACI|nr:NAD(P)-dependent oxidoreductase [Peribacillus cavernae]MDQ0218075.1 UDP-glucose 4-epimerase [Peribacillus cavernae]RUQ32765.1 NAD(P)-dependent oxidoreductase [Peribacillus cavernae]
MAILVTGGLGHVGSWTAYNLAKQGNKVIIYDPAVKHFDSLGLEFLQEVKDNLIFEDGDILDFQTTCDVLNKYRDSIEGIIHTAALIGVPEFTDRPYRNVSLNTFGTLNMLEVARIFGIKKFVYTSSGAVYGDTAGVLHEDTPYKATDLYGSTKISGELFSLQYGDAFDMDVRIARVYFIYGPGKMPSGMYPLYKGLFGPLEGVFNYIGESGSDTEIDFTHVWDVAQGVNKVYRQEKVENKVFNISSGIKVSLGEVVQIVKEILGVDTGVYLGPGFGLKRGAPLDIGRARMVLGYEPEFPEIADGIRNYLEWINKNKSKVNEMHKV